MVNKKIRRLNFPSEISENIVKFAIFKKYGLMPNWDDTNKGDLILNILSDSIKIEVKAFSSLGPISFGPNEEWDWIYFVDAVNYTTKKFKIYELKLKNNSKEWLNIKINNKETYNDQILQKRRPRLCFDKLLSQLTNIKVIFNNDIKHL